MPQFSRLVSNEDPLLFFFDRQFVMITLRGLEAGKAGGELPMEETFKQRRAALGRQKDKPPSKRLRPLGQPGEIQLESTVCTDGKPDVDADRDKIDNEKKMASRGDAREERR